MNKSFLMAHLGLGDGILYNGLVRTLYNKYEEIVITVYSHYEISMRFMFRDLSNVRFALIGTPDDIFKEEAKYKLENYHIIRLGYYDKDFEKIRISAGCWAKAMYMQAGVPWENRWSKFLLFRDLENEIKAPAHEYAVIHDDKNRDFNISNLVSSDLSFIRIYKTDNIFQWCSILENAKHIHAIDSSIAILADSIETNAITLNYYDAGRFCPPTYKKKWRLNHDIYQHESYKTTYEK